MCASELQRVVNAVDDQSTARNISLECRPGRVASGVSRHAWLGHVPSPPTCGIDSKEVSIPPAAYGLLVFVAPLAVLAFEARHKRRYTRHVAHTDDVSATLRTLTVGILNLGCFHRSFALDQLGERL